MNKCKPLDQGRTSFLSAAGGLEYRKCDDYGRHVRWPGLTLVPNSAQVELFCPPYKPNQRLHVSWLELLKLSSTVNKCKPLDQGRTSFLSAAGGLEYRKCDDYGRHVRWQVLTLVPNSAQVELFCPPYKPN